MMHCVFNICLLYISWIFLPQIEGDANGTGLIFTNSQNATKTNEEWIGNIWNKVLSTSDLNNGSTSDVNECHVNYTIESLKPTEILKIVDISTPKECNKNSDDEIHYVTLKLLASPKYHFKETAIALVHYFCTRNDYVKFSCLNIIWEKTKPFSGWVAEIQLDRDFRKVELYAVAATTEDEIYQQTIYLTSPRKCDNCLLERLVYNDITFIPGHDTVHMSQSASTALPLLYLLEVNIGDDEWRHIETYTETGDMIVDLPPSYTRFYRITAKPGVYTGKAVLITLSIGFGFIFSIGVLLWYLSVPRQKTVVVLYCQCSRHSYVANALRQIWRFLEKNCLLVVVEPSTLNVEDISSDAESLLGRWRRRQPDFALFIPFPAIPDHDRLSEAELHQLCVRYKNLKNKIEVILPLEKSKNCTSSDWPRNTYRDFKFFEELAQFIRYVHPCYYPSCLERCFRRELWAPVLEAKLAQCTHTNDHFKEVVNPKLWPAVFIGPVDELDSIPPIDLDVICS